MTRRFASRWCALGCGILLGCGVPEPTIKVSDDITTLAVASWTLSTDSRTRVEVDGPDGPWLTTDWQEPGATNEVNLLGLVPDTEYQGRLVVEAGDASPYVPFTTGVLPTHTPQWTVDGAPGWHGYILTAIIEADPAPSTIVVLDEEGRVVWYHQGKQGHRVLRARLSPDGKGVRYAEIEPAVIPTSSALVTVNWAGEETSRVTVPHFTHDFADTPEGDAACVALDIRPGRSGVDVLGDSIVTVTADGTLTPIWSIWDEGTPPADAEMEQQVWTHANAIDWDPGAQSFWLGMRELSTILQVFPDGSTGAQLGGPASTWTFTEPAEAPKFQHQFTFTDTGILIFDDRDPPTGEDSRLLELTLDDSTRTATKLWEWHHDPPLSVFALGDVNRAPDGSTLAVFSSAGVIDDLSPEGELRWELQTELAAGIPYLVRVDELPGVTRVR